MPNPQRFHGYTSQQIEDAILELEGPEMLAHIREHGCCHYSSWGYLQIWNTINAAARRRGVDPEPPAPDPAEENA